MTRSLLAILAGLALASAAQAAEQTLPSRSLSRDTAPTPAPVLRPMQPTLPAQPALPSQPVAPGLIQAPQPLFTPLAVNQVLSPPSLCVTIPATVDGILDKRQALITAWQGAGSGSPYYSTGKLKSYFVAGIRNNCCSPNVSFSVQEQQTAGCSGSDTVAACMDKLTRQCIRRTADTLHIREETQKAGDDLASLGARSNDLAQQLRTLQNLLP